MFSVRFSIGRWLIAVLTSLFCAGCDDTPPGPSDAGHDADMAAGDIVGDAEGEAKAWRLVRVS